MLGSFSLLLVLLALSMFGLYSIQVPARLQSWLAGHSGQSGGSLSGAAVMGFLSALIVGPCVAPPLVGALLYIAQSGDALVGGLALFSLGLGMGVPLLLAGTALGGLLPRAGAWMQQIQHLFGFGLLALAVWFAERWLPGAWVAWLWMALALSLAGWLLRAAWRTRSLARERNSDTGGTRIALAAQSLAALMVVAGTLWFAALPLWTGPPGTVADIYSYRIHTLEQLRDILQREDSPVVLDIYADWCVECKPVSLEVLPDPRVQRAMQGWLLVKADITANDADARALLTHYSILGPPGLLFFDAQGREQRGLRITGPADVDRIVRHLARLLL